MDISVTTESWLVEDRSWLASRDGTDVPQSITLDTSTFTANTHYPNGYVPSGTILIPLGDNMYGPYAGSASEGQTVTITGTPTGGTFTLTFSGQTTGAIAYNATAATVKTALEALSNLDVGEVTVTGGPGPGTPYVVTFGGTHTGEDVAQMTASATGLTGGTTPAVTVTTTTAGGVGGGAGTAAGFLFSSEAMRSGGPDVGAALLWRGAIKVSRLPIPSQLDAAARVDLAAKFSFR